MNRGKFLTITMRFSTRLFQSSCDEPLPATVSHPTTLPSQPPPLGSHSSVPLPLLLLLPLLGDTSAVLELLELPAPMLLPGLNSGNLDRNHAVREGASL
jgi:hypothetical protein